MMERLLVELRKSGHVGNKCCWRQLVLLALSVAASGTMYADEAVFRVENGTIIVSSPFDLEMGATEYAKIAGKVLRVHRYASYDPDTKKTTTNETAYARAKLANPYFGCQTINLNFGGKEKRLSNIYMEWKRGQTKNGKDLALTNQECRDLVDRILEDMKAHADMTVSASEDRTEEEALERIAEMYKNEEKPKEQHKYYVPFYSWRATRQRNGTLASYWLNAMIGNNKKHRSVSLSGDLSSIKFDGGIRVTTNRSSRISGALVPTPAQKKAHEEAAKMRAMLKRIFDEDFDATNVVVDLKFTHWSSVTNEPPEKEWLMLETPFEGMTEKKASKPVSFLCIPFRTFALRRPYDGDVEESELRNQATQLLARLERELGEKIPPVDNKEAKVDLAKRFGGGVPTFGDTRIVLGLDKFLCFTGKIGDIGIEIAYAAPRYAKSKGTYSIACRGAVIASFVQSPIFSEEQAKKKAK